jgi:N-acetylglucosamine-6-phosphate deacetylase
MQEIICYSHAQIVRGNDLVEEELFVQDGYIIAPQSPVSRNIDLSGHIIAPGFIDLQINGGFGIDFTSQPNQWEIVSQKLPEYGVTSFLATIVSQPLSSYETILRTIQPKKRRGAELLGIHLEGPCLNRKQKGAHQEASIQTNYQEHFWNKILAFPNIRMVTLAPELPGMDQLIPLLQKKGIVVACGHTEASGKEKGLQLATHLFNAMPFHHRKSGVIGAALGDKRFPYTIICDGHHLDPETIRLAWRANPEGLLLVSDATAALGAPSGMLGDAHIEKKGEKVVLKNTDTLAGTALDLHAAMLRFQEITGCTLAQAIDTISKKPAQLLGIGKKKGTLTPGSDADFVILDKENYALVATYKAGTCVYEKA